MLKKITIIILTFLVLISIIGCNNIQEEEPESQVIQEDVAKPLEVMEVSLALWQLEEPSGPDDLSNVIYDYIEENFFLDINPWTISSDEDWKARIATAAATDVLPDFFVYSNKGNKQQITDWANRGVIRSIPDAMWYKYENIYTSLSWYSDELRLTDGAIYFLPRTDLAFDQTQGQSNGFYYRKDWAISMGYNIDNSMKWSDFISLIYDMALSDPDKDTKVDTWGITGSVNGGGVHEIFYQTFGVREWVIEDEQWVYGMTSNRAKEATAWLNELYRDGVLDKDIFTASSEDAITKFATEAAGIMVYSALPEAARYLEEEYWNKYMPDTDINDHIALLPLPKSAYGIAYNEIETYHTGTMVSGNVSDVKLEQMVKLFDWLMDDEGLTFSKYGIKGLHYTQDGTRAQTTLKNENDEAIWFFEAAKSAAPLSQLATFNMEGLFYMEPLSSFQNSTIATIENSYWNNNWHKKMFTNNLNDEDFIDFKPDATVAKWLPRLAFESNDFDGLWDEYVAEITDNIQYTKAKIVVNDYASENFITREE